MIYSFDSLCFPLCHIYCLTHFCCMVVDCCTVAHDWGYDLILMNSVYVDHTHGKNPADNFDHLNYDDAVVAVVLFLSYLGDELLFFP